MKDKGDNPIVGRETTDIYDGENHGYKENYSLEKDDLEAFATIWTRLSSHWLQVLSQHSDSPAPVQLFISGQVKEDLQQWSAF